VEIEEDTGLGNYFKDIVRNANKYGEKIDLTAYKSFVDEYEKVGEKRKQPTEVPVKSLEKEVRGTKVYGATMKPPKRNEEVEEEDEE